VHHFLAQRTCISQCVDSFNSYFRHGRILTHSKGLSQ